jgi:vacuolar iron transporter family protein
MRNIKSAAYHKEHHTNTSSEYIKAIVFGGLDGIVTLFAIVAGCVGAHLSPIQTIIVGLCNLLADAVSMGFGEVMYILI